MSKTAGESLKEYISAARDRSLAELETGDTTQAVASLTAAFLTNSSLSMLAFQVGRIGFLASVLSHSWNKSPQSMPA